MVIRILTQMIIKQEIATWAGYLCIIPDNRQLILNRINYQTTITHGNPHHSLKHQIQLINIIILNIIMILFFVVITNQAFFLLSEVFALDSSDTAPFSCCRTEQSH